MASTSSAALTPALRAELAYRIRMGAPREREEFSRLWMAFNAIYGGENDANERRRVMQCIRRYFTVGAARAVLRAVTQSTDRILDVPPGNLLMNVWDPRFRAASQRYAAVYRDRAETATSRLAAVAAILYQVRCNLLHGSKDPYIDRDMMLVRESVVVLRVLVPALEKAARAAT